MSIELPEPEEERPSFGDMLRKVAEGDAIGFIVFEDDGDITYSFYDDPNENVEHPHDAMLIPMSQKEAADLLSDLMKNGPDELEEIGTSHDESNNLN